MYITMYNESRDIFCLMSVLFYFLHQLILSVEVTYLVCKFFPFVLSYVFSVNISKKHHNQICIRRQFFILINRLVWLWIFKLCVIAGNMMNPCICHYFNKHFWNQNDLHGICNVTTKLRACLVDHPKFIIPQIWQAKSWAKTLPWIWQVKCESLTNFDHGF